MSRHKARIPLSSSLRQCAVRFKTLFPERSWEEYTGDIYGYSTKTNPKNNIRQHTKVLDQDINWIRGKVLLNDGLKATRKPVLFRFQDVVFRIGFSAVFYEIFRWKRLIDMDNRELTSDQLPGIYRKKSQ